MSRRVDIKKFARFEKEENLFDRKFHGLAYWELLRISICNTLFSDRVEKEDAVKAIEPCKKKMKRFLQNLLYGLKSEFHIRKQKCDIIFFRISGKNDIFFDYWDLPDHIRAISIVQPSDTDYHGESYFDLGYPSVKMTVLYYFHKITHTLVNDNDEYHFLVSLEKKLVKEFGKCMSADRMLTEIQIFYYQQQVFEKYFENLFEKLQNKAIVVVCYYQGYLYAAYKAAKKKGIKIIELQHGVISNHIAYWMEDQRGINNITPDYFLAFGDAHIAWTKLPKWFHTVSTGFPFQEAQLAELKDQVSDEKMVVIYPDQDSIFESVIADFVPLAVNRGFKVFVKIHPLFCQNIDVYYPILSRVPGIEIITDQTKGIYYWLKRAKHHVMASTTVGLEAVAVSGTNICIATNVPHEQTKPLIDWGVARGYETAQQLTELIEHPLNLDFTKYRKYLWKDNAKTNIEKFIEEIV